MPGRIVRRLSAVEEDGPRLGPHGHLVDIQHGQGACVKQGAQQPIPVCGERKVARPHGLSLSHRGNKPVHIDCLQRIVVLPLLADR